MSVLEKIRQNQRLIYFVLLCASLVLGLLFMIFPPLYSAVTSPVNTYLQTKMEQVTGLTLLSTSVATGISFIPGNVSQPIANTLVNFSGYLLIIMIAIMMEKYIMVIACYASFLVLIPLGLLMMLLKAQDEFIFYHRRRMAGKLIGTALSLLLVIPVSVGPSKTVEQVYHNPVEETLETGANVVKQVENTEGGTDESTEEEKNIIDKAVDGISSALGSLGNGITSVIDSVKHLIDRFMESIAVLVMTCLLIPILVYWLLYMILKRALGAETTDQILFATKNYGKKAGSFLSGRKTGQKRIKG